MNARNGCCNLCYFLVDNDIGLRCHRYPPNNRDRNGFPIVSNEDWCGEFRDLLNLEDKKILDYTPLDLNFDCRILNVFEREGIKTVRDIISKTQAELLSYKNFGRTSLMIVEKKLAEYDLFLR